MKVLKIQENKRKTTLLGWFLMVDTKGLEPMTFRTSSGCSTS